MNEVNDLKGKINELTNTPSSITICNHGLKNFATDFKILKSQNRINKL